MNQRNATPDRDEVLFAFHQACERPTAIQITEWTKRYPQFADDIRAHAAVRLERAVGSDDIDVEPNETMLARGRSRALNAIYNARRDTATSNVAFEGSWSWMLSTAGFTIPQLARRIQIDRMVLAELAAGRMRLPIGVRLLQALMNALNVMSDALERAVTQLLAKPRLGHAKADQQPTVLCRSYEEIIRNSSMSDEQKSYWLGKD